MKMQWSVFYSLLLLLLLAGCGSEEFGSTPQSTKESADALKNYSHSSCSTYTLIKPKVDVVYVIDNSSSSYYLSSDVKNALSNTVSSLSKDFDYRVIGTPLLETPNGNEDYQVMTNSPNLQGIPADSRRITSAGSFTFFTNSPTNAIERGTSRVVSFINQHKNSLIRSDAYLVVVLLSNGRDEDLETDKGFGNGETNPNTANFNTRLSQFNSIKQTLNPIQLRLMSVTAQTHNCKPGFRTSNLSYVKMAKQLYQDALATDNNVKQDAFDLCDSGSVSSIFASINNSIKKVVLPHQYGYWPITFAEDNETVSLSDIKVHKVRSTGQSVELTRDSDWFYEGGSVRTINTRTGPNPTPGAGEPHTGRHFVRFASPIVYPDCVLVTSKSRVEYFDYVVLPQKPKVDTVALRINGNLISRSSTNGWSDETAAPQTINIKAPFPTAADENPPVMRTGFMLKLNGSSNYYKSGDSVQVDFIPAGI